MAKSSREILIEGYDGTQRIYQRVFPAGALSDSEIERMVVRLAFRHLSADEIINASFRKNSKEYAPLLELRRATMDTFAVAAGEGSHYLATIRKGP